MKGRQKFIPILGTSRNRCQLSVVMRITSLVLIILFILVNTVVAAEGGSIRIDGSAPGFIEEWPWDRSEYRFSSADVLSFGGSVAQTATAAEPEGTSLDEISKKMNNPVSDLWMLVIQQDFMQFDGDITSQERQVFSTTFQPVISVPLGDQWNLVNRPIFTFIDAELPKLSLGEGGFGSFPGGPGVGGPTSGPPTFQDWESRKSFGDFVFLSMLSPAKIDKLMWGIGPTFIFPTASDDKLGSEKYAAGPAGLIGYLGKEWSVGVLGQQWFSFAGKDNRSDVSKLNLQYFIYRQLPDLWQVTMSPNITANWEAPSENRWTVPIGLGVSKTIFMGKVPVRWAIEVQKSIVQPDAFGMDWNIRLSITPVIPNLIKVKQGTWKPPKM